MRVIIGCEESQAVCIAFRELGHEAYSCDLQECSGGHPEWHIVADVRYVMMGGVFTTQAGTMVIVHRWDMGIFHPPCTYLTCSAEWAYKDPDYNRYPGVGYHQKVKPGTLTGLARREAREESLQFVCDLLNAPIDRKVLENPIGVISSRIFWYVGGEAGLPEYKVFPKKTIGCIRPHVIQPYQFGDDASKATCLYYVNVDDLKPTEHVPPRIVNGKKRWSNQTDSGQNRESPSEDRAKIRSVTYPGIARAMAEQWGGDLIRKQGIE